jgi:dTDP-4-dehydrorhamnose reductase
VTDHSGTILVTGARGQLGAELAAALAPLGRVVAVDRTGLDLAEPDAIVRVVRDVAPAWIVNAAAYTAVDRAETDRERAFAINARAPGLLAEEAKRLGAILLHYSTDYVFDGTQRAPYDEASAPNPLIVYGASKLEGERAIAAVGAAALTLRTAGCTDCAEAIFFCHPPPRRGPTVRIVDDQTSVPNWSRAGGRHGDADGAWPEIRRRRAGLCHLSAAGQTPGTASRAIVGGGDRPKSYR